MSDFLLNIGDKYYHRSKPFTEFEVIALKSGYYYLAVLKGSCSEITYISESEKINFSKFWFKTSKEAELAGITELERQLSIKKQFAERT